MKSQISKIAKTLVFIGCLAIFSALTIIYANAENQYVFKSNSNDQMKIALTFDDGPHPRKTERILDVLDKYNVYATFFVIGVNVQNYPNVLENVIERGHELGNHTFSHQILKSASVSKIKNEISDTEDALYDRYSLRTNLLRPPCGLYDSNLVNIARENGYKIVLWTVDTKDWAHESAENIVKNVLANIKSGDIILFHDYVSGNDHTAESLNILIPKLQEMGYKFVTVSELLQS